MKNFRLSVIPISQTGQECSSRKALTYIIQFMYESEVHAVEISRELSRAELADKLIKLANEITNNQ
jgi:hypothetical protein